MIIILVALQILMLLKTAVIVAFSPGSHILLNGQMARLNQRGMAMGMFLVAVC
jgi:hypothetical protein